MHLLQDQPKQLDDILQQLDNLSAVAAIAAAPTIHCSALTTTPVLAVAWVKVQN